MIALSARGVRARFDPATGHLPDLEIDGVPVLHSAPWRDEAAVQADPAIPLVDRQLGGTFVCVPFGRDDVDGGAPHGLTANARWQVGRHAPSGLTARREVLRGRVEARLSLRDGHPALYQTHRLDLTAPCTFAHHPMLDLAGGGRITVGGAVRVHTWAGEGDIFLPDQDVPADGPLMAPDGPGDWRDYPDRTGDDFLTVTGAGRGLGWTAVERFAEGDTILLLKRAEQLPVTCLWVSNGGRAHSPWGGRHRGVLGVEDAICAGAEGFAAALSGASRLAKQGVRTALPAGVHVIPHAILRLPGCHRVSAVTLGDGLEVTTEGGPLRIPFETELFT